MDTMETASSVEIQEAFDHLKIVLAKTQEVLDLVRLSHRALKRALSLASQVTIPLPSEMYADGTYLVPHPVHENLRHAAHAAQREATRVNCGAYDELEAAKLPATAGHLAKDRLPTEELRYAFALLLVSSAVVDTAWAAFAFTYPDGGPEMAQLNLENAERSLGHAAELLS
jgi:hypothetical protein